MDLALKNRRCIFTSLLVCLVALASSVFSASKRPNILVIYTDDHRWDAIGASRNSRIQTPNIDRLSEKGVYFPNAFVTLSICAPSRAALLTGQYGSHNGIMDMESELQLEDGTLAETLADAGYATAVFGKWHLTSKPERLGFDYASTFYGLVPYWDVVFDRQGKKVTVPGFVDDATTKETVRYLDSMNGGERPFFIFYNSFAPHMDSSFAWPARPESLALYPKSNLPMPRTWKSGLNGKPPYIKQNRPYLRGLEYGYAEQESVLDHIQGYYASVTDMDLAVGKLMDYLERSGLEKSTYIILMGDNGWFNAEHGLTSKVLAYEESIRVPLIISGPEVEPGVRENLALNVDLMPTVLELAGLQARHELAGESLAPLLRGEEVEGWREYVYYEAPHAQHGTQPLLAVRSKDWKYVATYGEETLDTLVFEELYHLKSDRDEQRNLVGEPALADRLEVMRAALQEARATFTKESGLPYNVRKWSGQNL